MSAVNLFNYSLVSFLVNFVLLTMAPNSNITGDDLVITSITAKDMRWPTSLGGHGSDAMVS